jgi:hypothetical protein
MMAANEQCRGLDCRFAQIGQTTVSFDDPRFEACERVLTDHPLADPEVVRAERFVSPDVSDRDRCGYAVAMILQAQGGNK